MRISDWSSDVCSSDLQQVYAVRLTLDLFVDPIQLDFQSFRRQADSTQHAEAACVRHFRGHVAAVRESEKREIDSQLPAKFVVHFLPLRWFLPVLARDRKSVV